MGFSFPELGVEARACLFAVGLASAVGCSVQREPDADAPLAVQLAGCAFESQDGTCMLAEDRTLGAFVAGDRHALHVEVDGAELDASVAKLAQGTRLHFTVPQRARQLVIRGRADEGDASFVRALRELPASRLLAEAASLRSTGDLDGAARVLTRALPGLSGLERARAQGQLARVELARGHNEAAVSAFREALQRDRALGLVSQEMADGTALVFLLAARLARYGEAQAVLDATRAAAEATADGRARFPYFEGLVAFELGDLRSALASFRSSYERAQLLGLSLHAFTARDRVAAVLDALGRSDEAIRELEELGRTAPPDGCERADLAINLGWYRASRPEPSQRDLGQALSGLEAALSLFPGVCPDAHRQAIATTNLAYAALGLGQLDVAQGWLARARALPGVAEESLRGWWLELEGRIALGEQRPRVARVAFERALAQSRSLLVPDAEWRALVGLGDALEALDDVPAALAAFERAEALLDAHALAAPLGEGRAAFLARHADSARGAVALSVRAGDAGRALAHARRARARLLQALEHAARVATLLGPQRAAWTQAVESYRKGREALLARAREERDLPVDALEEAHRQREQDERALTRSFEAELARLSLAAPYELRALPDAQLSLLYHRGRTGFLGFAVAAGQVRVRALGARPAARSAASDASWLLAPFAAELARATRVRVLAEAELLATDFHALPFGDGPLLAHAVVSYPLDLSSSARGPLAPQRALVVSDPARNLPHSRAEAASVARRLSARGLQVERLEGDAATRAALGLALSRADHVHFAGHALFAGNDGWDSRLGLARGESMALGDLLALRSTARSVVLASCEAGQASQHALRALSMADAFALAGADSVLAPTRPVDDGDTAALMEILYERAAQGADFPEALRDAQLALRARGAADWSAFRVITR